MLSTALWRWVIWSPSHVTLRKAVQALTTPGLNSSRAGAEECLAKQVRLYCSTKPITFKPYAEKCRIYCFFLCVCFVLDVTTGVMYIRNISEFEFGEYQCNASNVVGFATCSVVLHTGIYLSPITAGIQIDMHISITAN